MSNTKKFKEEFFEFQDGTTVIFRIFDKSEWKSEARTTYKMYDEKRIIYINTTEENSDETRRFIIQMYGKLTP